MIWPLADYDKSSGIGSQPRRSGYTGRGDTYRAMGKYDAALAEYDKIVALLPYDAAGYSGRGDTYRALEEIRFSAR